MKTHIKNLFALPALIAGLTLMLAITGTAQTFTTLHSFTAVDQLYLTNSDGANPYAGLITSSSGNTLYGTAQYGGSSDQGTVFAINADGTGFTNLHNFAGYLSDGGYPEAGLILSNNTLYGTASQNGTVFAVNTDGTGFTNLYSGGYSLAGLLLFGNTLYGTTYSYNGTVFAVNIDGTGFTNLHSFNYTDGGYPQAGLLLMGSTLYGTTHDGGSSQVGTVFKVNTDGTGFTNLHSFTQQSGPSSTNSDGAGPGGLVLSGNTLYGTAADGGNFGTGTVFALNTDGTGFTTLHSFTSNDGAGPVAGLILSGKTLYGTAVSGGSSDAGTVFAINTDGTDFTTLHSFTAGTGSFPHYTNSDGANPRAGLILLGNTLYGTTLDGGSSGNGTVFSLSFAPQLTINHLGTNVFLSWPTNVAGFDYSGYKLQSAPALTGTFTNLPAATNPYTNPITGDQMFFRLSQ